MKNIIDKVEELQSWFLNNRAPENMIYKSSFENQILFIRDEISRFFDEIKVISSHTSKSIKFPVYQFILEDKLILTLRGNLYDWKVSVEILNGLKLPGNFGYNLFDKNDENLRDCYFEGFPKDLIYGNFTENNNKFSLSLPYGNHYLFCFIHMLNYNFNQTIYFK